MNKKIVSLRKVIIRNFKSIKEMVIPLSKLNEFYGANQTGKSSVLQAIHFIFQGKKSDTEKIALGEEKTEVELELLEDNVPIKVKTRLKKGSTPSWTMEMKGTKKTNPREILKRMLSFGTFNPREMLNPKERVARLLQLIPLKVQKEDILDLDGNPLPIVDEASINYNLHAYNVLKAINTDLRTQRHSLYTKKELLEKSYNKRSEDLDQDIASFKSQNNNIDPLKYEKSHTESVRDDEKIKGQITLITEKQKVSKEKIHNLKDTISDQTAATGRIQAQITNIENEFHTITRQIDKSESQIKLLQSDIQTSKNKLANNSENKTKLQKEVEERQRILKEEKFNLDQELAEYQKHHKTISDLHLKQSEDTLTINRAKNADRIQEKKKELQSELTTVTKAKDEWNHYNKLIKKDFSALQNKILSAIDNKIPGLKIDTEGVFRLNGVSLDELSGSEVIKLGIQLMRLENKGSNLILINEAEAVDMESLKDFDFSGEQVIIARVGDEPIGGEWNSIKMEEPSVNKQ